MLPDSVWCSLVKVGTPIVYIFRLLMYDHSHFAESDQINAMYHLWSCLVSLYACVHVFHNL